MPSINRIRVNNVKYNFGTQGYDDFSMRMYGRNTLYDLANGGGKSVLMLLLMQNLIPNCTLDDKQPIEKLFRDPSNTVIHSLIEWKLDAPDVKDGMRYMTTGFAAKKASGSEEEREDGTAEIEYFNYVLFYREYNKNDIINLPLEKDNEHISYKALRNYLHDLARNDKNMLVYVFDRKGEYQKFIAGYGLFESHWEIVRGINKTEGHVRTYFESHYKTTRRVIEDLLIEEIIEKAYITKTSRETDKTKSTASLLMTIQEELRTLSEKKKDIKLYDYERELLELLTERIRSFMNLYLEQEKNANEFGKIFVTLRNEKERSLGRVEELENAVTRGEQELINSEKQLELLKLMKDILAEEGHKEEIDRIAAEKKELDKDITMQESLLRDRLAAKEYMVLKEAENELRQLDTERQDRSDDSSDIYRVVAAIYNKMEEQIKKDEKKLAELELSLEALQKNSDEKSKAVSEAYTEVAVLENRKDYIEKDISGMDRSCRVLQEELSQPMLGDAAELIESIRREITEASESSQQSQAASLENAELLSKAEAERDKLLAEKTQTEILLEELDRRLEEYETVKTKMKSVSSIYTGDKNSPVEKTEKSLRDKITADTFKLYEKKKELTACEKKINEINDGRLIAPTRGVEKVIDYIVTRHGKDSMFGMDYVSSLPEEMQEDILDRLPGLPYGIVVKDLDGLSEDTGLKDMDIDEEILLYDWDSLDEVSIELSEGVTFVRRPKEFYTSLTTKRNRLDVLEAEMSGLREDVRIGESMLETLREDLDFVHLYMDKGFDTVSDDRNQTLNDLEEIKKGLSKLGDDIGFYELAIVKSKEAVSQADSKIESLNKDIKLLEEIRDITGKSSLLRKEVSEIERRRREIGDSIKMLEKKAEELRLAVLQDKDEKETLKNEIRTIRSKWDNRFSMYYVEGSSYEDMDQSLSELEVIFERALGDMSEGRMSIEKEKLLRNTLIGNVRRQEAVISELGVSLDELRTRDAEGSLKSSTDELISEIRNNCYELKRKSDLVSGRLSEKKNVLAKLEGSIEYARNRFFEKYGEDSKELVNSYRAGSAEIISVQQITESVSGKEKEIIIRRDTLDKARRELSSYKKEMDDNDDILKMSKRIVDGESVDITQMVPYADTVSIGDIFERTLLAHDRLAKDIDRAKADTMKVKLKVYDSLMEMNVNELAGSIRDDTKVPETAAQAHNLIEKLSEVSRIVSLEKERVEKSLVGMEQLKDSFIEECIERCLDVRSELDKLSRLSEITMDGQKLQMIKLTIPYVKDEFIKDRMSEFIDSIVEEMDKKETDSDKQKFLNASLSMKKLFSVIVTDMSKIKLMLYKRERIREQSRYLRYEEAVGSTGQSQGIYIQFLISIINYISGMYASTDGHDRSKTLFIDNPFGAAKDIYIWEPIFSLLAENNCQLIVPARGATPEITGRFDINYVLGQQMTGKRTTTVVTHFSSKTKGEELEYKDLDYEQQSFDFI